MKIVSSVTREMLPGEALYRAEHHDVVDARVDSVADAIRSAYKSVRIFTYNVHRMIQQHVADEWEAHCVLLGISAEQGYLHMGGVRHQIVGGGNDGWYPMNIGNAAYRSFCNVTALKTLLGIRYGAPLFTFPPALDAIIIDLTLWYSNYDDVNNENIINTDEYVGTGELYRQLCREAFVETQAFVATAIGSTAIVYPNFGNLAEAERGDPDTAALIAAAEKLVQVEQAVRYTSAGEPNLVAESCETRWATINTLLNGTRELMLDGWVLKSDSTPNKERAKLGVAAWMMMGYKAGMLARFYYSPEDAPEHSSEWEDSSFLKVAHNALGDATGTYSIVSGAWVKGKVYVRQFENGRAYLFVRKAGQVGSEDAVIDLGATMMPLGVDEHLGAPTTNLTLSLGQAAVMIDANGEPLELEAPIPGVIELEAPIPGRIDLYAPTEDAPGDGFTPPKPPLDPPFTEE